MEVIRKFILVMAFCPAFNSMASADDYLACRIAYDEGLSGNYITSIEHATECLAIKKLPCRKRKTALLVRAWGNYGLQNYLEAVIDQTAGMQIGESSKDDYRNLALYLKRAKKYPESLKAALEANRLDRESGGPTMPTQYHLGWAYYDNGQFEEAISTLSEGVPLQPDFPFVYFWRAMSYEKLGDNDSAMKDLQVIKGLLENEYWLNNSGGLLIEVKAAFERFNMDL